MTRSFHSAGKSAGLAGLEGRPGAYLLVLALDRGLDLAIGGRPASLAPGLYAYCGSAYGPGGLAARLSRHLRPGKKPHWHVDRLTAAGRVVAVYAQPGGSECALLNALRATPETSIPLPGFGSSDCRRCPAHLLQVPEGFEPPPLPGLLQLQKKGSESFFWRQTAPLRRRGQKNDSDPFFCQTAPLRRPGHEK